MLINSKKTIITFCTAIIILLILYVIAVLVNFFTKDSITKEMIVGITPVIATKSIMNYQEPITVILEEKEKKTVLQKQESEEILQNVEEIIENQEIEEKSQEYFKVETDIVPEQQIEEDKKEISVEAVTEETKQEQLEEIQNAVITAEKEFTTIGKIEIPQTGVNIPILNQVTVEGMKNAPCLLYTTGKLNENGNNLIVGHNFRDGTIFSNNKYLKLGDKIFVTTLDGNRVEYTIYNKFITTAEDVSYIKRDTNNKPEITLSCCTDDDEYRIIILAKI